MKNDIKSWSYQELNDYFKKEGLPNFRTDQVFLWLHKKYSHEFSEMSNLPEYLIQRLEENFCINRLNVQKKLVSKVDHTVKYLYRLQDENLIETVYMKYQTGTSVCISTQVGCKMGCKFCASTKDGFVRNLSAAEMLDQIYQIESETKDLINNVVLMGIGEPLDNLTNVLRFISLLSSDKGRNLSKRRITLSTCGLADQILQLAGYALPITLSVSLHAPNDNIRTKIMPVARLYPISILMQACDIYTKKTGRRITYEYTLIKDVNDSKECAKQLAELLKGRLAHVNIIPVNPIHEYRFMPSLPNDIKVFYNILNKAHIPVSIRKTMGKDISAACGQLRKEEKK